ncbi:hypothetical protein EH183_30320 [Streptomyces sp. CB01881]|nr:hypothetical protein EH183_30320 [Streptomyces sp. CB01881]
MKVCFGSTTQPAARARATTCRLAIESPPNAKKLSSSPTRSTPTTPAHTAANAISAAVSGAA